MGKIAGYKGSDVPPDYLAILKATSVLRSDVEEVRVGFEPQLLTEGVVDIFPVFIANEPDTLSSLGFETLVLKPVLHRTSKRVMRKPTSLKYGEGPCATAVPAVPNGSMRTCSNDNAHKAVARHIIAQ